jgi:hypothetical protein
MKPSVLMLSVAFGVLAGTQILPESLPVSVAQIGLTGALLVWFVTFSLRRAHRGSFQNQAPSDFPHSA